MFVSLLVPFRGIATFPTICVLRLTPSSGPVETTVLSVTRVSLREGFCVIFQDMRHKQLEKLKGRFGSCFRDRPYNNCYEDLSRKYLRSMKFLETARLYVLLAATLLAVCKLRKKNLIADFHRSV
jgi:hypothetical protein